MDFVNVSYIEMIEMVQMVEDIDFLVDENLSVEVLDNDHLVADDYEKKDAVDAGL